MNQSPRSAVQLAGGVLDAGFYIIDRYSQLGERTNSATRPNRITNQDGGESDPAPADDPQRHSSMDFFDRVKLICLDPHVVASVSSLFMSPSMQERIGIVPRLIVLSLHGQSLWRSLVRASVSSVRLELTASSSTAAHVLQWVSNQTSTAASSGEGRHITVRETLYGPFDHQVTLLHTLGSDATSWTVEWNGRVYEIRKIRDEPIHSSTASAVRRVFDGSLSTVLPEDLNSIEPDRLQIQDGETLIDYIEIICHGDDKEPIFDLINHCCKSSLAGASGVGKIKIYHFSIQNLNSQFGNGMRPRTVAGRSLQTLDLPPEQLKYLTNEAKEFFHPQVKEWYKKNGTPWRKGWLFQGPPGTGKSSFAAALATELQLPVYKVDLAGLNDEAVDAFFNGLPDSGCILLLEDIDSAGLITDDMNAADGSKANTARHAQGFSSSLHTENSRNRNRNPNRSGNRRTQHGGSNFGGGGSGAERPLFGGGSAYTVEAGGRVVFHDEPQALGFSNDHGIDDDGEDEEEEEEDEEEGRDQHQLQGNLNSGNNGNNGSNGRKGKADKNGKKRQRVGVTVSALINLIDGVGAKEGRLLIMTTNRAKAIDPRLLRSGRVQRPFHYFGHSTPQTAAQTFKRIFGTFPVNPTTGEELEELANKFGALCPRNLFTPADLQEYCAGYRGRPHQAVADFPKTIERKINNEDEELYDMHHRPLDVDTAQTEDVYRQFNTGHDDLKQGIEESSKDSNDQIATEQHSKSALESPMSSSSSEAEDVAESEDPESSDATGSVVFGSAYAYANHPIKVTYRDIMNGVFRKLPFTKGPGLK